MNLFSKNPHLSFLKRRSRMKEYVHDLRDMYYKCCVYVYIKYININPRSVYICLTAKTALHFHVGCQ